MKNYRQGAVGAMMDEYDRAAGEYQQILRTLKKEDFEQIRDAATDNEDCRSVQTITSHMISAGYSYANYIRTVFGMTQLPRPEKQFDLIEVESCINKMLAYTIETLEGHWLMSEEEIMSIQLKTRWGGTYDLEQLLEHAIVHVLRHRRQVERFLATNHGGNGGH